MCCRSTVHTMPVVPHDCRAVGQWHLVECPDWVETTPKEAWQNTLSVECMLGGMIYPKMRRYPKCTKVTGGGRGSFRGNPVPVATQRSNHNLTGATKTAEPGVEIKGALRRSWLAQQPTCSELSSLLVWYSLEWRLGEIILAVNRCLHITLSVAILRPELWECRRLCIHLTSLLAI
jgi:hypothetical protein